MNNRTKELITAVLVFVAAILLAMNTTRYFGRIDMTETKEFTITNTTKDYIKTIPEQVNLTYFISDKVRAIAPAAGQIEDLLFEYAANSRGHISTTSVDPSKNVMEAYAKKMGITAQQVQIYDRNELAYSTVFSGILIQYLDRTVAIPFILDASNLEYELSSKIQKLVENQTTKIGLLAGDDQNTVDYYFSYLQETMKQNGDVIVVNKGEAVDPEITVLYVLGNKDFTDSDLRHVDEYIMNGGKAVFALDGVVVDMANNLKATKLEGNPAIEMLKKWGITINNNMVLDKYCKKITMKGQLPMNYPMWLSINSKFVNKDNPITAGFASLDMMWASSIDINPVPGLNYQELFTSTDESWILNDYITGNPYEAFTTQHLQEVDKGTHTLAYAVTGQFPSAYSDRVSKDTKIIVAGDSDFLSNLIEYTESPANLMFAENMMQWLDNDRFMNIKTRSVRDIRLNKITDLSTKVKAILAVYLVNIFIIPAGIIIYGIVRYIRRKRKDA
ncbi:MAG: GldG family protein [Spirochaetia bacterium]|nr:GldG family protein [Spirochaetia bacterium]